MNQSYERGVIPPQEEYLADNPLMILTYNPILKFAS